MTAPRSFDELFEPQVVLSLVRVQSGYIVWDQTCRFYILAPSSLEFCLRFLQAGADRGDWLINDASIERATWHSVRVPDGLSEREPREEGRDEAPELRSGLVPDGMQSAAARPSATQSPRSESPSNVVPIRKGA